MKNVLFLERHFAHEFLSGSFKITHLSDVTKKINLHAVDSSIESDVNQSKPVKNKVSRMYTFFISIFLVIVILLVLLLLPACCMICKWRRNERSTRSTEQAAVQVQPNETNPSNQSRPYVINIQPAHHCTEPPPYEKTICEDQPPSYDEIFRPNTGS